MDKTLERLSSGLRINHAADDAAGLAITQKMDTQVRGLGQANRNAMDGISLIQTAEGALNEVHSMLQRIRELSVQVSNGTYDASDRKAVQDEVAQLTSEVDRISQATEFNKMKLLNGDIDRRAFSTDSDVADIVSMSDTVDAGSYEFDVAQLASRTSDVGGVATLFDGNGEAKVSGTININGEQIDIKAGESSEIVFSKIRDLASRVDVSVTIEPVPPFGNGKSLKLEMNQYGPRKLQVTGDLALLTALGLDEDHFRPNTNNIYKATQNIVAESVPGNADGTFGVSGNVLINGTTVSLETTDDNESIYTKLKAANIEGLELTFNASGHLTIFSSKPITIEPAVGGPVGSPTNDDTVAAALSDLADGSPVEGTGDLDLIKSTPQGSIALSGSTVVELNGILAVFIGGVQLPDVVDCTGAGIGNIDLDSTAGRAALLARLNTIGASVVIPPTVPPTHGTTFAFTDEASPKLVAYNTNGKEVTIKPASNIVTADKDSAENLGFASSDVTMIKGFGNLGRNVQIDASSMEYDDPLTLNFMEGFPAGTTVTTSGRDIVFQSNNNFELRLVAGETTGTVTMNLLETGPLDLQIGANEGQFMEIRIQNLSPRAIGITDINLSTAEGAQEAIGKVDAAITTISAVRSKLGAYQNRLEHTIANLEAASENMTASLSRILDADMALEMASFTQQNIIAQAGTSMLAQANQRPQSLLQLLQN